MYQKLSSILFLILAGIISTAHSQTRMRLWEENAPGSMGNSNSDIPTLEVFKPDSNAANGAGILMVPGGSYGTVVMSEAEAAKSYYLPKGFTLIVLKYRVAPYKYPIPMYDVKRAMRMVRNRAREWELDTNRIGILGCSAGGHLASYLATHFDMGNPDSNDPIERQKSKPDFGIFVYPVITMDLSFTHRGSRSNLLGNNPSQSLVDSLSNEKQVTEETPPSFLVHGTVDKVVQWENSQEFFDACKANQVETEFHKITESCGEHGFGYNCENWGDKSFAWLEAQGFLEESTSILIKTSSRKSMEITKDGMLFFDVSGRRHPPVNMPEGAFILIKEPH